MNIYKVKKTEKFIFSIIISFILITTFSTIVLAGQPSSIDGEGGGIAVTTVTEPAKKIVGIIQLIGVVASVIVLILIGIKYMMGSVEEKAEYKKSLMPYIIGCALVFAASVFAQILYDLFSGVTGK